MGIQSSKLEEDKPYKEVLIGNTKCIEVNYNGITYTIVCMPEFNGPSTWEKDNMREIL